ncbi:uncharacterized protein LY79DRAFT_574770 [Colletotrichum navitas]|uniref:Uncharacterized protein n=1 Tax=Colletotrichum navitas TaxID=681940 RepID=A0AAD8QD71_9PEZI|nr:uncharacterized protein LY79DRAFT_574770 [Colletotrichum navitas]KAK1600466.1 hypothetical protein LY79DRAFT_574770 [Colletotrichum navitas]
MGSSARVELRSVAVLLRICTSPVGISQGCPEPNTPEVATQKVRGANAQPVPPLLLRFWVKSSGKQPVVASLICDELRGADRSDAWRDFAGRAIQCASAIASGSRDAGRGFLDVETR